uniref:fimbria/pilus periplasmic chaperone n=1 Tax=Ningiella ruwaisensis TaxID=2364274 RepID=UPI00109F25F9|nr:fimbria/pilus periplasmic chaperone [Ningiella ruwaisensis]
MKLLQCFVLAVLLTSSILSHANLLVTPKRVVFSDRDRTQQVVLVNAGNKPRSYRIEWKEYQQLPTGGYKILSEEEAQGRNKASDYMRFSPRQVRLEPGERQVVKIMARRKAGMPRGEYRSHLLFTALPPEEEVEAPEEGISMKLHVLVSYSIPVMMNIGYETPNFSITNIEVAQTPEEGDKFADLNVGLDKLGDFSAYGRINAFFKPEGVDNFSQVAVLNGVNVFGEANEYNAKLTWLEAPQSISGILKLQFEGQAENAGVIFAEKQIQL